MFEGNEYKIQNLYIKTENSGAGIILNLNKNGSVKNLIVDNGYIDGYNNIGSISGKNYGLISNCTSQNVKLTGYGDEYGSVIMLILRQIIFMAEHILLSRPHARQVGELLHEKNWNPCLHIIPPTRHIME